MSITATDDGFPPLSATRLVTIRLIDVNENPVLVQRTDKNYLSVNEEAVGGSLVGLPISSDTIEPDNADANTPLQSLSYSIIEANTSFFQISALTGQIFVKNDADIDYEIANSFALIVAATDNGVFK